MTEYLLDTNTCIELMRGHSEVVARTKSTSPASCFVSTITSYELFTGVAKCADPRRERAKVEHLLEGVNILTFLDDAARQAGEIRAVLEASGQMIGPYDVLLAGQALAANLTMATANTGEFERVPGLTVENWQEPI